MKPTHTKAVYAIYRNHRPHAGRVLIGRAELQTIIDIHGKNITFIDDQKMEVTVKRDND